MDITSRLPTEILEKIFLHAIDGPISNMQDNSFPWALDQVCKSWRSAFVSYPDLWTCIAIDLREPYSRGQDLNAIHQWLSLCLQRSRNYPLNISLYLPTEEYDDYSPSFTLVWKTFLSCSHRWRFVYLENVHDSEVVTLDSCTSATPILESLTIISDTYIDLTAFQIAPHLTHFGLVHPVAVLAVGKWSMPWMQLTTLILIFEEIDGIDQLCVLVKQLRDIEELYLGGSSPEIELSDFKLVHNSSTPQCLQHLRILVVSCVEIFSLITAPSLSELGLGGSKFLYPQAGDGEVLAEEILSSFVHRSSCEIQKLNAFEFSEHPLTPLVQLFPHVVELCLVGAMLCLEDLLSPNQFPALHVLDCSICTTDTQDFMEILLAILELRNGSSTRCSAAPLAKVIFRPVLKDGEESDPVTTTDWASFENHVQIGSYCALDLTRQFLLPEKGPQSPPPAPNVPHNTNVGLLPSSSPGAPLNPGSMHPSNSLDDFDSNIFRNDGNINFEQDFVQWFNGDDAPLNMK